jgi:hypothetical protein
MAPPALAMSWVFYTYLAYAFLAVVARFRVRTVWAVFLAGAVYGWLAEGMIVQTMYQDMPVSLVFTGLSWHALFSVLVGWYFLRKSLLEGPLGRTAALAGATGLVYGFWAVFWWTEPGQTVTPFADFALYAATTGAALVACYWLCGAVRLADTHPSRAERWILAAAGLLYFAAVTVPANPLALVILPAALGALYASLRRNRRVEAGEDAMAVLARPARPAAYAAILLIPAAAIAVYGIVWTLDLRVPSNVVVYYATVAVSAVLLPVSIGKVATRARHEEAPRCGAR